MVVRRRSVVVSTQNVIYIEIGTSRKRRRRSARPWVKAACGALDAALEDAAGAGGAVGTMADNDSFLKSLPPLWNPHFLYEFKAAARN